METRIARALNRTLDTIASDLLACIEEDHITADEAREVTVDADRLEAYGNDKEAVTAFREMSREEQDRILADVFPDGMTWC